ncbi:ATP-dependent 6-phosphofructokinase [Salsipaludibacter albus]|uniref:ATP-dependent 6-phosphofructokinase n=1 Tax=Salsipaludibacter albus TaxID=2849650 RepID=UPI001EE3D262|nr:ATP-dependent 6-phosphofructokinase [Salsipaludibacter albus]MBY5163513.1 6-phosphofructokinase [Salsipaludibacter albus]
MQRLAVLTSGGDAPGMNAVLRGVVRAADAAGLEVVGVRDGYRGLHRGWMEPIDARAVSGILHIGGTILGTARSRTFRSVEGREDAVKMMHEAGVDGLVVVGGDGSLQGADLLAEEGDIPVVGVPGTIDNDLAGTDFTIGFDTAVNTALEAIDRIRDTASSHHRLFFIEVMGRHAGWIATYAGIAGGATASLVPEQETDIDALRERVRDSFDMGKRFCLVVVAEGEPGGARGVASQIFPEDSEVDLDHRVTSLGHMQRGGSPSMRDRVLGARLGDAAVTALLDGANRIMVGEVRLELNHCPMVDAWSEQSHPPAHLFGLLDRLAR